MTDRPQIREFRCRVQTGPNLPTQVAPDPRFWRGVAIVTPISLALWVLIIAALRWLL